MELKYNKNIFGKFLQCVEIDQDTLKCPELLGFFSLKENTRK